MKKYIILSVIIFSIPFVSFAAISYNRTPNGTEILNPVTITTSFNDLGVDFPSCINTNYWRIFLEDVTGDPVNFYYGVTHTSTTLSSVEIFNPSVGFVAYIVSLNCGDENPVTGDNLIGTESLETGLGNPIFTIFSSDSLNKISVGARIDNVNLTFTDFLITLIQKYWPFLLGATLLVIVWAFGKKILHYFT